MGLGKVKSLGQGHSAQKWKPHTASSPDSLPPNPVPFPLPHSLGTAAGPASVSALEKWQRPHFPQLPVEDLSVFLRLVTSVCVCVRVHTGVYFTNLLPAPNSSEIAAGIILKCPLYSLWF